MFVAVAGAGERLAVMAEREGLDPEGVAQTPDCPQGMALEGGPGFDVDGTIL
jgi:hypothetical protein